MFEELLPLFRDYIHGEEDLEYHPYADDSIICGCDCGCDGDSIDWDEAREEYNQLVNEQTKLRKEIEAILEGASSSEGGRVG